MVYPDEFIPLFEQNGFIRELDLFVLDTVCAWIRRRLDEGKKVPPISINQSKALFFHDNYVETVLGIAARHDVPAHLLHVEVTESMAWLDEEAFIRTLDALRRAGIGLSLDDFGKGYSSMAMLHSFGFDTIKLDRAFLAWRPKISCKSSLPRTASTDRAISSPRPWIWRPSTPTWMPTNWSGNSHMLRRVSPSTEKGSV